jgi:anhydro-N-acetylmuramic acid kinase
MARYFLGLISGTSVDGVDAALCDFGARSCRIVAAKTFAYPPAIERRIQAVIRTGEARLAEIGALDVAVGRFFADCALALIRASRLDAGDVEAIGHHGQTIWHDPDPPEPFSWQLGDPNSVAAITGIDTVADLRRLDMAVGGQGAPLAPGFHAFAFASDETPRIVLNIGGIANLTQLAPGRDVLGFDCGPGNTLLDSWAQARLGTQFDEGGRWAASGRTDSGLLDALLDEPYFSQPAPKSTGRELFNETWLKQKLGKIDREIADADVAATLLELTARTIVDAVAGLEVGDPQIFVCGGGAKNGALLERIGTLSGRKPSTTAELGIDPDWVEAAMMAWLARARLGLTAGNVPTVTAAREARVLGGLYWGRRN